MNATTNTTTTKLRAEREQRDEERQVQGDSEHDRALSLEALGYQLTRSRTGKDTHYSVEGSVRANCGVHAPILVRQQEGRHHLPTCERCMPRQERDTMNEPAKDQNRLPEQLRCLTREQLNECGKLGKVMAEYKRVQYGDERDQGTGQRTLRNVALVLEGGARWWGDLPVPNERSTPEQRKAMATLLRRMATTLDHQAVRDSMQWWQRKAQGLQYDLNELDGVVPALNKARDRVTELEELARIRLHNGRKHRDARHELELELERVRGILNTTQAERDTYKDLLDATDVPQPTVQDPGVEQ